MRSSQSNPRFARDAKSKHRRRAGRAGVALVPICLLLLPGRVPSAPVAAHPALLSGPRPATHGAVSRAQARAGAVAPALNVGSVIVAEPASDTPLPIQIGPAEGLPKNSFVRIRGLPPSVALSEGHAIAPGAWAVPFVGLPALRLNVPVGLSGRSEITVALVTVDGVVLSEVKAVLVITTVSALASTGTEPRPKSVASLGPAVAGLPGDRAAQPRPGPPTQPPRSDAQQHALRFITRGNEQLREGDVSAARLFFQRAVDARLPEGALAMASSYDQIELDRLGVRGLTGDRDTARKWYEEARKMGAVEAEERLRRLGGR